MTDKRKIQIQQNKIKRLESENQKIKQENEDLKRQLAMRITNDDEESIKQLRRELENSIKEHNDIVIEFRDLKDKYKQKINEVNKLIAKIKKLK